MERPQMIHKTAPIRARNVAEPEGGGAHAIKTHDAFEPGGNFRKRHSQFCNFLASSDPYFMPTNHPQHSFSRALIQSQNRIERKIGPRGSIENCASQRMLRIPLQAR